MKKRFSLKKKVWLWNKVVLGESFHKNKSFKFIENSNCQGKINKQQHIKNNFKSQSYRITIDNSQISVRQVIDFIVHHLKNVSFDDYKMLYNKFKFAENSLGTQDD